MPTPEVWFSGFLLLVAMPAAAVGGVLLVRRTVGPETLARHNDVAGFIYAVIGVVYAVLLGFTAIIVWEQFRHAQEIVEAEANALADLYRDAQVFPPEVRDAVGEQLRAYARLVVEKEWPAMAAGKSSPETWEAYNEIWRTYHEFKPQDEHQRVWYAESVSRMNFLGDQRRSRLLGVRSSVPGIMWMVLLGAGAVAIGFCLFFGTKSTWAHSLMTAGLAITIGLVLLSILALEHPFSGITRVDSEAFEQALRILGE
ncbi:MAG: DUF4239 domain-containing protein [Candidatus Eiseniibacteriota bacterium]